VTLAVAGADTLLLLAWQDRVALRSSLLIWGTDKVFWTVPENVDSKEVSIKWLSLHHVTSGLGSPVSIKLKQERLRPISRTAKRGNILLKVKKIG
jgi:hypothetical protein